MERESFEEAVYSSDLYEMSEVQNILHDDDEMSEDELAVEEMSEDLVTVEELNEIYSLGIQKLPPESGPVVLEEVVSEDPLINYLEGEVYQPRKERIMSLTGMAFTGALTWRATEVLSSEDYEVLSDIAELSASTPANELLPVIFGAGLGYVGFQKISELLEG